MIVWVLALGLALPAQAAEESLADKAARARKAKPGAGSPAAAGKVLTNEDLATAKGTVIVLPEPAVEPVPEAEAGATAEAAAKPAKPEPTEDELRAQAGAALQKQIDSEAELIRAGQKAIAEWEAELNDITNYTFGTRRAALMQNIEDARKTLADAQRKIGDLEDQARRQGIRVTLP
jgi:hypothetical protein